MLLNVETAPSYPEQPVLITERENGALDVTTALKRMAAEMGGSYLQLIRDYIHLAVGHGKIVLSDYETLRLFASDLSTSEKARFLGYAAGLRICNEVNFRTDWFRLVSNKLSSTAYLSLHGFPTVPTLALFHTQCRASSASALRNRADLESFVRIESHFPVFGKPVDAFQSLGSVSFDRFDHASDSLVAAQGTSISVPEFASRVSEHYADGYLFQPRIVQHEALRRVCGGGVATIRVLTAMIDGAPRAIRACWKIPAGANAADNFWRSGNLLAGVDLATGEVSRVICGTGFAQSDVTKHPDTGEELVGFRIPQWSEVIGVAVSAAQLFSDLSLLGWDIGITDAGPIIVEVNESPDMTLPQLADRRGMLDDEFKMFIRDCKSRAADWERDMKRKFLAILNRR